jgi:hypothetical protein
VKVFFDAIGKAQIREECRLENSVLIPDTEPGIVVQRFLNRVKVLEAR